MADDPKRQDLPKPGEEKPAAKPFASAEVMHLAARRQAPDYHERLAATPQELILKWIREP